MRRSTLLVSALAASLWISSAGPAWSAGATGSAAAFYKAASPTLATVEFVQEFMASGQRQQTRSWTDGVVVSADGFVLISGRVRFPQRGSSGRLSGGSLPELVSFRLHFADGREHDASVVAFDDDLNLGVLRITDGKPGQAFPHV